MSTPPASDPRRKYEVSTLAVIADGTLPADKKLQILLAVYGEAAAGWRMLTDVRFKLLALIPPVSALALFAIVSPKGLLEGVAVSVRIGAAIFGFAVTLGLYIYETRNDELYNDLISRGRRAEEELGVHTGVFKGRLKPKRWIVSHSPALDLVYGVVLLGWIAAGVAVAIGLVK